MGKKASLNDGEKRELLSGKLESGELLSQK